MKRIAALAFAAAALAVPAAQAHAAGSQGPTLAQFKALQKQVKTLQAQVKTLQTWVSPKCTKSSCFTIPQLSNLAAFTYEVSICQQAALADEFQATWTAIDTALGKTVFGPQTSISDGGACTDLKLTRPTIGTTPNAAIFSALVSLLTT